MARIWQEGFEDGLPNIDYLEGNPNSQFISELSISAFPDKVKLSNGRNAYSQKSLALFHENAYNITKTFTSNYAEVYFRTYFKHEKVQSGTSFDARESILLKDTAGNFLISIYNENVTSADDWAIYAKTSGTYGKVADLTLAANTWYKVDIYFKTGNGTGAYEVKINDISIISSSSDNTGTLNVKSATVGSLVSAGGDGYLYFDDIAINDTSGAVNNSWCGSGTIVSLKPKAAGNSTQWDTSQGYALGESGTTTTNVKITAHGLATNDVCYNKTRDTYRIVTVVDVDNFTVSSVTSQTTADIFVNFTVAATITATTGTTTSLVVIAGHTVISYDVTVNTSRSNAIRRVIYVNGNSVYNSYTTTANGTLGSTVASQVSGDSIKTFKVKQYAIANHWETVSKSDPNPQISNIQTTTSGDIDLFDMQELTADLGIPTSATIVAVSANIYAQEAGAGSQIQPVLRIAGTNYEGTAITLSSGTLEYQTIYDVSPATSSAFTRAAIDAIEAGVKLV